MSYYPPMDPKFEPPMEIAQVLHVGCFDSRPMSYRLSYMDNFTLEDRIYNTWQMLHRVIKADPEKFMAYIQNKDPDPDRPPQSPDHFQQILDARAIALAEMTEDTKRQIIDLAGENYLKNLMAKLAQASGWKDPWMLTATKAGQRVSDPDCPGGCYWVDCIRASEETFEGRVYFSLGKKNYICIPFSS